MIELSPEDQLLDPGHLQLEKRAHNSCAKLGIRTIQGVRSGLENQTISEASVGRLTVREIVKTIAILNEHIDEHGCVNWPAYWEHKGVSLPCIYMTSAALRRLSSDVRGSDLGRIHLGKALSGLEAAGISTVGGLVAGALAGIGPLGNFGKVSQNETVAALKALSAVAQEDGSIDWMDYAMARGFKVIPSDMSRGIEPDFFATVFPQACKEVILAQFDERAWLVFSKRLLVSKEESETLQTIGDVVGTTRERVRQIEQLCLGAMRRPLLEDDYRSLSFLFHPDVAEMFKSARDHFESMALPAWTRVRWLNELCELWHVPAGRLSERYRLLAEILGYQAINLEDSRLEPLVVQQSSSGRELQRVRTLVELIHASLADGTVLDSFGLVKAIKKSRGPSVTMDEIPELVALCSTAEMVDGDLYQFRFGLLRGRVNQVVRVLSERGEPMSQRDLAREINCRVPANQHLSGHMNLVNQMSGDARLTPIGKSGRWALTEWGVETRSLIELLEEVLASTGEAMHLDDLKSKVLGTRPGAEASIQMLLDRNPERFRKIMLHVYALASWGDSVSPPGGFGYTNVAAFVKDFFESLGVEEAEFGDLTAALCAKTGLQPRSARGILAHHPAVAVRSPDSNRRIARYDPSWESKPRRTVSRSKPLLSETIVDAVIKKLKDAPTGERPLIELVKELESELKVIRASVYAAIDQSDEVEKISVDGSVFKICRLVGRSFAQFPQLATLGNSSWREECERAVKRLNVEDVDLALFQLGRQFDQAMCQLLMHARDVKGADVTEGHLKTLQSRIDWSVKNQVFNDKATLNLLRVERNERGHQPPTQEERHAIMKFAPFLAELYIDYLILIDAQMRSHPPAP